MPPFLAKAIATTVFHVNVVMGGCSLSAVISTSARKLNERVKWPWAIPLTYSPEGPPS